MLGDKFPCILDHLFQSAPGREAGRCLAGANGDRQAARFNPRPAVRPGDARCIKHLVAPETVSIRARP